MFLSIWFLSCFRSILGKLGLIWGLGAEWVVVDSFMDGLGLVMSEDGKDSYFQ